MRKPDVAVSLANLKTEALRLERELRSERYRPGRYAAIEMRDSKRRIVIRGAVSGPRGPPSLLRRGEDRVRAHLHLRQQRQSHGRGTHRSIAR